MRISLSPNHKIFINTSAIKITHIIKTGQYCENGNGDVSMKDGRATFPKPELGEPYLLTPGPLTTSIEVKRAMLRDWGSWDKDFKALTADLRRRLLALLGPGSDAFECVPVQGSGTFGVKLCLAHSCHVMARFWCCRTALQASRRRGGPLSRAPVLRDLTKVIICHHGARMSVPQSPPTRPSPMSWPFTARRARAS